MKVVATSHLLFFTILIQLDTHQAVIRIDNIKFELALRRVICICMQSMMHNPLIEEDYCSAAYLVNATMTNREENLNKGIQ